MTNEKEPEYYLSQARIIDYMAKIRYKGDVKKAARDYVDRYSKEYHKEWETNPAGRKYITLKFQHAILDDLCGYE